jgi:hypothetical protein
MKWRIEIGTRVRHHVDTPNMKFRPFRVVMVRVFSREKITDYGRWQPLIGNQPILDHMAQIEKLNHERKHI